MLFFLVRRAIAALVLVFVVTSGAVLLAGLSPGDFASQIGRRAEDIAQDRPRLGLDLPASQQYLRWLRRAVTVDLGESFQ